MSCIGNSHLHVPRIHTRLKARVYIENTSDAWHIPWYPTRKHCITSIYYITLHYNKLYYIILYYTILYYTTLHYIILYHITSHHITSYHIISYHIISYHIISYHIISYHIILYYIILYYIILYTEFFPCFYGPRAKRAGHENKEGKNEDP